MGAGPCTLALSHFRAYLTNSQAPCVVAFGCPLGFVTFCGH